MKLLRALSMVAVLGSATLASADEKREEVSQADAEKFLGFFNKFVDAVVGNKDACPKMATSVNTVIDQHLDVLRAANAAREAKKKLPKSYEDKMMARVKEMMPAMQKCGTDKDVQAAIGRMDKKDPAK
ncbi:MAG: hypothetical protein ABI867_22870 [Kofleriaceae bacterium]